MTEITIRAETPADFPAIARIVEDAFGRAEEARVVERLRASENYVPELALVAAAEGSVAGHIMFTYAPLHLDDGGTRRVLILAPVAVTPRLQKQRIGDRLIRRGFEIAESREEPLIVVLGHPSYYPRLGFRPASEFGIAPPSPELAGAFFAFPLTRYDPALRGRVEFPPAFDESA